MSDEETENGPEPIASVPNHTDSEKYTEEVSVEYWDSLMQSIMTLEKHPADDDTIGAVDALNTKL